MVRRSAGALRARTGTVVNVSLWHDADVQRLPGSGLLTGALPTLGAECRFTSAFQTLRWHAAKVGS
jgi:hypothetical protein